MAQRLSYKLVHQFSVLPYIRSEHKSETEDSEKSKSESEDEPDKEEVNTQNLVNISYGRSHFEDFTIYAKNRNGNIDKP